MDGLTGFSDAVNAVFPQTEVQLWIVHMIRNSVKHVPYKDLKAVTGGLKEIYLAPSEDAATSALEKFAKKKGLQISCYIQILAESVERDNSVPEIFS